MKALLCNRQERKLAQQVWKIRSLYESQYTISREAKQSHSGHSNEKSDSLGEKAGSAQQRMQRGSSGPTNPVFLCGCCPSHAWIHFVKIHSCCTLTIFSLSVCLYCINKTLPQNTAL